MSQIVSSERRGAIRNGMLVLAALCMAWGAAAAETPKPATPAQRANQRGPVVESPKVAADRKVTFRILAPKAAEVRLNAGDIPGDQAKERNFTKGENGVWELTVGPIDAGTYRYLFSVDGVGVVDPRNPSLSQSNNMAWSVVHVPGSEFQDENEVPHGAVAAVHYYSKPLGKDRRMHVYTPPGYESGSDKYPVFYLLHGASDSDDSWTSVGRANFILDNLIAAGKAKPMIVVMPAGHTSSAGFGAPTPPGKSFEDDFTNEIRPYIESHYRVLADREHRAIAGLSMGGSQTLNIAMANPKDYGYVGVFSSGVLARDVQDWEKKNAAGLDDASAKGGLKLLWFKIGSQDFLLKQSKASVELLKKHGFSPVYEESSGGHMWINWRNYLHEFAPQLFGGKIAKAD